ncbi:MAG: gephyrin-like molybdotransferase Glp [Hyphomicrobiaceae bacterium]
MTDKPLSVDEAIARILDGASPLEAERVAIEAAHGRTLAEALVSRHTQPPFDASAMDGYAVREADLATIPARLKVTGESAAGRGYRGSVGAGEAVRIFTGAPVPDGADAIVIQEDTTRDGDIVVINDGQIDRGFIRKRGFDFAQGARLLEPGRRLNAREVTLAAAMGHGQVPVHRRPRVAILATGDELVMPGVQPSTDQIVCSNPFGIAAMIRNAGGDPRLLGIAADTRQALREKLEAASDCDVIVTVGGASVGEHDLVGPVLADMGMALDFWKIAMRPGKPLMHGTLGHQHVLGLPGNPVSSLVCTRVFVMPLIRRLAGLDGQDFAVQTARLSAAMPANGPRQHYARAIVETGTDGETHVTPVRSQDSSLISVLAQANGLIVQPPQSPAWPAGTSVSVLMMDF